MKKHVVILGGSGKLGRYMIGHALARGYQVTAVCRPQSVEKLKGVVDDIDIIAAYTDDRAALSKVLPMADAVLVVLAPWGMNHYASKTAQAVLDFSNTNARLIFSCGWHISRDGRDVYASSLKYFVSIFTVLGRLFRWVDIQDQVRATDLIFASDAKWTVVRGCDLEEGDAEGLPIWAEHVGDPKIAHNRMRRIDFADFMVTAIDDETLIQTAPAIASCVK